MRSRRGGRNFEDMPDGPAPEGAGELRRRESAFRDPNRPGRFKVAFSGEEYGFGYRALLEYGKLSKEKHDGRIPDAGGHGVRRSVLPSAFDFDNGAERQPLRTRELALTALTTEKADFAIVPFYTPDRGYDTETLLTISKLFSPMGVDQVAAGDSFCLAVYESQVLELAQSSHPGSAMARLLTGQTRPWAASLDPGVQWSGGRAHSRSEYDRVVRDQVETRVKNDTETQLVLKERISAVFAGPEATRRCKAKLDGLRAAGVAVEETLQWVEPQREMARRVRETLDSDRQTQTFTDLTTGRPMLTSFMSARAQTQPLYGVVLPLEVALNSPEFIVVDPNFDDASTVKTRFLVCEKNYDHTLFEDKYKFAMQRVPVWKKRLFTTAARFGGLNRARINPFLYARLGLEFLFLQSRDSFRVEHNLDDVFESQGDHRDAAIEKPCLRVLVQIDHGRKGVESVGRLEAYLRYYGVRYATVRMGDDVTDLGPRRGPAPMVLDIEFDRRDFLFHPKIGSVVEGFLWEAFNISRFGMPRFLAAMPARDHQLADVAQRRWWNEGIDVAANAVAEKFEAGLGFILSWPFKFLATAIVAPVVKFLLFTFVILPSMVFEYHPASKAFLPAWAAVFAGFWVFREQALAAVNWALERLPSVTF